MYGLNLVLASALKPVETSVISTFRLYHPRYSHPLFGGVVEALWNTAGGTKFVLYERVIGALACLEGIKQGVVFGVVLRKRIVRGIEDTKAVRHVPVSLVLREGVAIRRLRQRKARATVIVGFVPLEGVAR